MQQSSSLKFKPLDKFIVTFSPITATYAIYLFINYLQSTQITLTAKVMIGYIIFPAFASIAAIIASFINNKILYAGAGLLCVGAGLYQFIQNLSDLSTINYSDGYFTFAFYFTLEIHPFMLMMIGPMLFLRALEEQKGFKVSSIPIQHIQIIVVIILGALAQIVSIRYLLLGIQTKFVIAFFYFTFMSTAAYFIGIIGLFQKQKFSLIIFSILILGYMIYFNAENRMQLLQTDFDYVITCICGYSSVLIGFGMAYWCIQQEKLKQNAQDSLVSQTEISIYK